MIPRGSCFTLALVDLKMLTVTNKSTDFDLTDIDFGCEVYFIPITTNLVAFYEKTASFQASFFFQMPNFVSFLNKLTQKSNFKRCVCY